MSDGLLIQFPRPRNRNGGISSDFESEACTVWCKRLTGGSRFRALGSANGEMDASFPPL